MCVPWELSSARSAGMSAPRLFHMLIMNITSFHFSLSFFFLFLLPAAADAGAAADVLACPQDNFCMRGLSNFYPDLTKRIRTSYQSKFYEG